MKLIISSVNNWLYDQLFIVTGIIFQKLAFTFFPWEMIDLQHSEVTYFNDKPIKLQKGR